jgi:dihydropyrimidinase
VLHYGHRERGVPLERLTELVAQRPAQIFGIYPRKGTIAIGGDADLTIVDTALKRIVDPNEMGSYADFTPLQGKELTGWPVATVKAGEVLVEDHKLLSEPGRAEYLARTPDVGAPVAAS